MPSFLYYQPHNGQSEDVRQALLQQARQLMVCQQRPLLHRSFLTPSQISARYSSFVDAYATLMNPFDNLRVLRNISTALNSAQDIFVGGDPNITIEGAGGGTRVRPVFSTGVELFADGDPLLLPNAFRAFLQHADQTLFTMKALAENLGQNALALQAYRSIAEELSQATGLEVPVGLGLRSTANTQATIVWVDGNRDIYTSTRPINITHDGDNVFNYDDDVADADNANSWTSRISADPILGPILEALPMRTSILADMTGSGSGYFVRIASTFADAQSRSEGLSKEIVELFKTLVLLDELSRHATFFSLSPLVAIHGVLSHLIMETPELVELIRLSDIVGYTQYEQHCSAILAASPSCSVGHRDFMRSVILGHSVAPTSDGLNIVSGRLLLWSPQQIWAAARLIAERLATANLAQLFTPLGRNAGAWTPSTPVIELSSNGSWLPAVSLRDYRRLVDGALLRLSDLRTESGFVMSVINADLFPTAAVANADVLIASTPTGVIGNGVSTITLPRNRNALVYFNDEEVLSDRRSIVGLVSLENYITHFRLEDTVGRAFMGISGFWPYLLPANRLNPFKRRIVSIFARQVLSDHHHMEEGGYLEQVTWAQTLRRFQWMSYQLRDTATPEDILAEIETNLTAMNPLLTAAAFVSRLAASAGIVIETPDTYSERNAAALPDQYGTVTLDEFILPLTQRMITSLNSQPTNEFHLLW